MKTALTIAGSDPSGGAGIQADLKTMLVHGVYGMSAVTALTAQNTTGVYGIEAVTPEFLAKQLDAVFTDIFPDAVKIGMTASAGLISVISEALRRYHAVNIVLDPVLASTSGTGLLDDDGIRRLTNSLFPLARLVTPNIPEAERLTGTAVHGESDMFEAAERIGAEYGCAVLLKGGHASGGADDLLYDGGRVEWFRGERIRNPNTHGTGCTLSSAIAANLANGAPLSEAVLHAKEYINGAISAGLALGRGRGPLDHGFPLKAKDGPVYVPAGTETNAVQPIFQHKI